MSDIKPVGIDQITGQQRPVEGDDTVVGSIGNQIMLSVVNNYDYSNTVPRVTKLFPWSDSPNRLPNPATTTSGYEGAWSPNNEFLAIASHTGPLGVWQRVGANFYRLPDPASLPPSNTFSASWSPNGEFLAFGVNSRRRVYIYQRSGSDFTLLDEPASAPSSGTGVQITWSPNGEFLAVPSQATGIFIYQRSNSTFTLLPSPASVPTNGVQSSAWSPDGKYVAFGTSSGARVFFMYERNGAEFTLLPSPASAPTGDINNMNFSPNGEFLAVSPYQNGSRKFYWYQRDGATLTLLSNPASISPQNSFGVYCAIWSPDSKYLATAHNTITMGEQRMLIFEREGTTLSLLNDPSTLPPFSTARINWSSDQQFMAFVPFGGGSQFIYQTSETLPSSGVVVINKT